MDPDDARDEADRRLEAALDARPVADPRPLCRKLLLELRNRDPAAYEVAAARYTEELVPEIVEGETDPVEAWAGYAMDLARGTGEGRVVEVDRTGLSHPYSAPADPSRVLLYLRADPRSRALVIRAPRDPSSAQRAAVGLLAEGWRTLPEEDG